MKKLFSLHHKNHKSVIMTISKNIFRIFGVVFLLIALVEYLVPGFFTNWFNPLWVLLIVVLSAIIMVSNSEN